MGFYGNIKNTSRTQFTFDRTYANRAEMDNMAALDGIYAGRFVLIEYDTAITPSSFPTGYLKDGIVYTSIPNTANGNVLAYELSFFDMTDPETGDGEWRTGGNYITPGTIIRVPAEYNYDQIYYTDSGVETQEPRDVYFVATNTERRSDDKEPPIVPIYRYDSVTNTLSKVYDKDGIEQNHIVSHVVMVPFNPDKNLSYTGTANGYPNEDFTASSSQSAYRNYIFNYNVDRSQYGVARGYDSTVWQKVYENAGAKYVMVAELNSVVPTFDVAADAPTTTPILPHFDTDSTNVYYKLHWQPQWGFRIKGSDPDQMTPHLMSSGSPVTSEYMKARIDKKEYPSDFDTTWKNQIYNSNNGETTERVFIVDDGNGNPDWITPKDVREDQDKVPAAIYFNKAGFSPENVVYSYDKEYRDWNTTENTEFKYLVTDEIAISPTGQSGHAYNVHGQKGIKSRVPDIQELSIMLPSIGDSMAEIWDLIYGGRNLNPDAKARKMDVNWYNAKAVANKDGVRLINTLGPGRYSYDPAAASTVAGILNSAQDLMGMIITDEMPEDEASANGDYIYYNPETQKYYFKFKDFKFTTKTFPNNRIPDDYNPYETVDLKAWDKKYFYVDTATLSAWEFVMENKFYPDRKYIETGFIDNAMEPVELSAEYKPNGTFFTHERDVYPGGSSYNYFVASYETFNPDRKYYEFTPSDIQLNEGEAIYIPNTYYYIDYEYVELTNTTYEPNVYYYQWGLNNLNQTEYRLATDPDMEAHVDGMGNKVTAFYKRRYVLDTSLRKQDRIYYRVAPNGEQSSNAYYKQNKYAIPQPEMTYEMYAPDTYYYIGTKEMIDENGYAYELIGSTYYIKDSVSYSSEEAFNEAGHEYFSIKIEYELVQGKDVIEITDENAIQVSNMRDLTDFQNGDIDLGQGTDVFYTYVDAEGATRYIEVNYNNFAKAYNSITQNYELIVMHFKLVGDPYHQNTYYYQVTDETNPKAGSYLIDNSKNITPGRQYYTFVPQEGFDYTGEYLTGYFSENSFYVEYPEGSGIFIPVEGDQFDPNVEYLDPTLKLYVENDTEGIYEVGAEWPMEVKQIPEGVTLATREDDWKFKELPSFGDKLVTLHGLLLKLYRHVDETDALTRDTTTARGSINKFEDLMHRFSSLTPGQFTIVDDYGRMHSAEHTTSQGLTFSDGREQLPKENALITISIDSDFKDPSITILHSDANEIESTISHTDVNGNGDTIELDTPIHDNAGHIVAKNTNVVTLPYGFKFVTPANSSNTGDLTSNTVQIEADNTQDNLTIASQNKWIKLASQDNTLQIAHAIVGASFGEQKTNSQDATPKFGDTFNVPVITVDNAGHVTEFTTETVKIPGLTYQEDTGETNDVVLNIAYSYNTNTDTGEFVETRGKVDTLKIQDYDISGVASAKLANTDTIHGAFAKLQAQINAMDLAKVGGGTGEYLTDITVVDGIVTANKATLPSVTDTAVTGEFVSKVSETHGQISVSRIAFEPSITIGAGTADAAPSVNVTVNSKSGTAQALTIATTGVYGVTKLTTDYSSTSTNLAMTGAAVNKAFETLTAAGKQSINAAQTIKSWKEDNGIISIEIQDILIKNANIAEDAAIAMTKIDGLAEAFTSNSNALLGNEQSETTSMTIHGLSKRIDSVIGTDDDTIQTLSIKGTLKKVESIVGTDDDTAEDVTIKGLLKKIAELEARIEELHPQPEEPTTPPEGENGDETGGEVTP